MEGAEQIDQDPHLPLFAHYTSTNAAWAPTDPRRQCLLFSFASLYDYLLLGLFTPPLSLPWFWDVISLMPSL